MESVWDYPRPPAVEPSTRRARVVHGDVVIADSERALRVLETSQPPAVYFPPDDVRMDLLEPHGRRTLCEWKGQAHYWSVAVPEAATAEAAAWSYPSPVAAYAALRDFVAFYPQRLDACFLDEERVQANEGGFYGGWVTADIAGPFKGGPGTAGW
jgi:uncharacterized protein (DUF427 family)